MAAPELSLIVVGGGVAGLSLARAAAVTGVATMLVDRAPELGLHRPDHAGASALPAALVNPWRGRRGAAHPDDLRGLAEFWRLEAALRAEGLAPGATGGGVLRIPTSERQAREWRERAASVASLAWLVREAVPAGYRAPFGALRVEDGGRVTTRRWLEALVRSARAHGATVRAGVEVAAVEAARDGGWRVIGAGGDEVGTARRVAVCVGADAVPAVSGGDAAPADADWVRNRGEMVTLRGGPAIPHPVAGAVYGIPAAPDEPSAPDTDGRTGDDGDAGGANRDGAPRSAGDRRTCVGGGHRPPDAHDEDAPTNLRRAIAGAVPQLAAAEIERAWSGVRAKRPDARPVVHERAPGLWTFGAFAGRGFLCAADRADRLVRSWLRSDGAQPSDARPPER